ncbi:MAG: hypothetical protein PHW53_00835 [Patescibacteria group bacterium]|nr:hypothetical protein [Patescibacteria group bacterium]
MEEEKITIIVCRHPGHNERGITLEGIVNAIKLARYLVDDRGFMPERIVHSGTVHTRMAASFMGISVNMCELRPEENQGFLTAPKLVLPGENELEKARIESEIAAAGGMVKAARELSARVRRQRDHLQLTLHGLAMDMREHRQNVAWVVSHGAFAELATTRADKTPYPIANCDSLIYSMGPDRGGYAVMDTDYIRFADLNLK